MLPRLPDGSARDVAQGRVVMPRHAEARKKSHRSGNSNWLPGILLVAVVCAVGYYFGQNPEAAEQARNALGFGRAKPAQEQAANAPADSGEAEFDPVEALQIRKSENEDESESEETLAAFDQEDASPASFLPQTSNRRNSPAPRQSVDLAGDESPLDQRFERDSFDAPNNVQTAELVEEPAEAAVPRPVPPRVPVGGNLGRRNNRIASDEAESELLPTPQARPASPPQTVHLTAGDDAESPAPVRRPGRPAVKASPATVNSGAKSIDLGEIRRLLQGGQEAEAYHKLSEAYFQFPSQRAAFQQQLDEVAQRIYFSPQPQIQPPYEIQPGDQLRKIANKYQLSWQYVSRLNQVDARKIRAGKQLKVFQGPFEARVDLSDYELTILLNGQYVKRYSVGIGKTNSTPIGEFVVKEKLENPTYYGPNGLVLDADDPKNPLGERWIDIGNSFGIHGTIEPDSIGKSESAGCVRMRNDDVAEVYDLLIIGSQVRIQR